MDSLVIQKYPKFNAELELDDIVKMETIFNDTYYDFFDEDYEYRIVDTYTISGGLGDTFTVDLVYPDEPIYELYSAAGFSDIEGESVFLITNYIYIITSIRYHC